MPIVRSVLVVRAVACVAALVGLLAGGEAFAIDYIWTAGNAGGTWSTTTNWNPAGNPTTGDTAALGDVTTGSRTVVYDGAATGTLTGLTLTQTTAGATNLLDVQRSLSVTNAITLGATAGVAQIALSPVQSSSSVSTPFTATGGLAINLGGTLSLGVYNVTGTTTRTGDVSGPLTLSGGSIVLAPFARDATGNTTSSVNQITGNFTMTGGTVHVNNSGSGAFADRRLQFAGTTTNISGGSFTANVGTNLVFSGPTITFHPTSIQAGAFTALLSRGGAQSISVNQVLPNEVVMRGTGVKTYTSTAAGNGVGGIQLSDENSGTVGSATTLKLGSNLTLATGRAMPATGGFATHESGRIDLGIDTSGFTLNLTGNTGIWTPNRSGSGVTTAVWTLSGAGSIIANGFNLAGTGVTANVGAGLTLESKAGSGVTNNLGGGTINATSTFVYSGTAAISNPSLLTSTAPIGNLSVTSGVLKIDSIGGIAGGTTVSGGTLIVNTAVGSDVIVSGTGTLAGSGSTTGTTTIGSGGTISPGNSPGTWTTGGVFWGGSGNYNWQLLDATGAAGSGWDFIDSSGSLTINATSGDRFNVNLWTLAATNPDVNGSAANFDPATERSWTIGTFDGGITGATGDWYTINTAAANGAGGFANSLAPTNGFFSLAVAGNDLNLVYNPVSSFNWGSATTGGAWESSAAWSPAAATTGPGAGQSATLGDATANRTVTYNPAAAGSIGTLTFTQTSAAVNELAVQRSLTVSQPLSLAASGGGTSRILLDPQANGTTVSLTAAGGLTLEPGGELRMGAFNPAGGSVLHVSNVTGNVTVAGGSLLVLPLVRDGTNSAASVNSISGTLTMTSGTIALQNESGTGRSDRRLSVSGDVAITGGAVQAAVSQAFLSLGGGTIDISPDSYDTNDILIDFERSGSQAITTNQVLRMRLRATGQKTVTATSLSGGNLGSVAFIDGSSGGTNTRTTLRLGSDLTLTSGAALPVADGIQSPQGGRVDFGIDVNGFSLDLTGNVGVWTPNRGPGSVTSAVWDLSGAGTIAANGFDFSGASVTVEVGAGLTLESRAGNGVATNLGSSGTIAAGSTFRYAGSAGAATPASLVSARPIGNLVVASGALGIAAGQSIAAHSLSVTGGTLLVDGTLTSSSALAVAAGGVVGGSGTIAAALSGAGLVSPGNSPGILTATQVDPTGGLDQAFEFTATGSPAYGTAAASVNDVLRLTDSTTPFTTSLSAGSVIDVYFDVAALAAGDTFRGGFYTDRAGDFASSISGATYAYWVKGNGSGTARTFDGQGYYSLAGFDSTLSVTLSTVAEAANFGGGTINGQVTQFAVVPEPGTLALGGIAAVGVLILARRRPRGG